VVTVSEEQAVQLLELASALRDDLLSFCAVTVALIGLWMGYVVIADILDVLWMSK